MSNRDLVFVSYSHRDSAFRDKLKLMLKPWMRRGLAYWADDYVRVGERWERAIDNALRRSRVGVLLVSPSFLASDFIVENELPALCRAQEAGELTLVCVALSASSYQAAGLGVYQFSNDPARPLDTLSEADQHAALVGIVEKIAGLFEGMLKPPPLLAAPMRAIEPVAAQSPERLGGLHGVPALPRPYLARDNELAELRSALIHGPSATVGIIGIQGLGGIGKSVLATALARDQQVRQAFPDGVYFIALGQAPELTRLQNALALAAGTRDAAMSDPLVGRDQLRKLFANQACLLILDDVWQLEHALPFDVLGPRGRALVTTRDAQLLHALSAHAHGMSVLDPETALCILAKGSGQPLAQLPRAAQSVAEECGYLPLALALAAAQVRDGVSFQDVLSALEQGRLEFLDHPYGSVWKSLGASVRALPEDQAARYVELSVVPEDTAIPASVIARLWRHSAGLQAFESNQLLVRFANKGLLYLEGEGPARTATFHDLQLDYLRLVAAEKSPALHALLLDAVSADLPSNEFGEPNWSGLSKNEQYLWQHLIHHLLAAGRVEQVSRLMRDSRWLQSKLAATGGPELLREFARVRQRAPNEACTRIERALRLESGWLYRDPGALPALLYDVLLSEGLTVEAIAALIPGLAPAIRLRHPVHLYSGELHVFRGHLGTVHACAYSPDGARAFGWQRRHATAVGYRDRSRAASLRGSFGPRASVRL